MDYDIEYGTFNTENVLKKVIPILTEIFSDQVFVLHNTTSTTMTYRLKTDYSDFYYLNLNNVISKNVVYANEIIALRISEVKNKHTDIIKKVIHIEVPYKYTEISNNNEINTSYELPDF